MANILSAINSSFSLADLDLITFGKNRNFSDIVVGNVVTPPAVYDGRIASALLPASQVGWKYITNIQFDMDAVRGSFGRQIASFATGAINVLAGGTAIFSLPIMFTDTISPETYLVVQLLNTAPLTNVFVDSEIPETTDYKVVFREPTRTHSEIQLEGVQNIEIEGSNREVQVWTQTTYNFEDVELELDREVFNNNTFATYEEQKIDSKTGWVQKENGEYVAKEGQTFENTTDESNSFRIIETELVPSANDKVIYENLILNSDARLDKGSTTDTKNDVRNIILKDVNLFSNLKTYYFDTGTAVDENLINSTAPSKEETVKNGIYLSYMSVKEHILREAAKLRWRILMVGYSAYGKSFYFKPIVTSVGAHVIHYRFFEWEEDAPEISQQEKDKQGGETSGVQKVVKRGWRRSAEFGVTTPPAVSQDLLDQIDDAESLGLIKNAADYRWGVYNVSEEALLLSDSEKKETGVATPPPETEEEESAEDESEDSTADKNLSYNWSVPSSPSGSSASLSQSRSSTPSFVPDKKGSYVAALTVGFDGVQSAPSVAVITVTDPDDPFENPERVTQLVEDGVNVPPVAVASSDADENDEVFVGQVVKLSGGDSYDPNGDPLTYDWEIINKPSGSGATIQNPNAVNPRFVPDLEGVYVIELTVSDGVNTTTTTIAIVAVTTDKEDPKDIPIASAGSNREVIKGSPVTLDGTESSIPENAQEEKEKEDEKQTATQKGKESIKYWFVNGGLSRELSNSESAIYEPDFVSGELTPNERFFPIITAQNLIVDPEASGQLITETGGVSGSLIVAQYSSLLYQTELAKEARAWIEYETPGVPTTASLTDWSMLGVATTFSAEANMDVLYDKNANRSMLFSGSSDFKKNGNRFQNDYLNSYRFDEGKINEQIKEEPSLVTTSIPTLTTGLFGLEFAHVNGISVPVSVSEEDDEDAIYKDIKLNPNQHTNKRIVEVESDNNVYIDSLQVNPSEGSGGAKFSPLTDLAICLTDNAAAFNNNEKDVVELSKISTNILFNFTDSFPITIKQQSKYIVFVNLSGDSPPPIRYDIVLKEIDKDVIESEILEFTWPCYITDNEGALTKLTNPKQIELKETGEKVRFDYDVREETIFDSIDATKPFVESRQVSVLKDDFGSFWSAYENQSGQINISRSSDNALTWDTYRNIAVPFRVSSTDNYVFKYPRLTKIGKAIYLFYSHDNNILYKVLDPNFLDSIKTINQRKEIEKLIRNILSGEVSQNFSKSTGNMLYQGGSYNVFSDKYGEVYLTYETEEGIRIISSNDKISWEINWKMPEEETEPIKMHNISDGIVETSPYILINKTNLMVYYLAEGNLFRKIIDITLLSNKEQLFYADLKEKIDSINPEFVAGTFTNELNTLFEEKKLDIAFPNAPNLTNDVLDDRKIESVQEGSLTGYINEWGIIRILFRDQASKVRSFLDYAKAGKVDDVETILRTS